MCKRHIYFDMNWILCIKKKENTNKNLNFNFSLIKYLFTFKFDNLFSYFNFIVSIVIFSFSSSLSLSLFPRLVSTADPSRSVGLFSFLFIIISFSFCQFLSVKWIFSLFFIQQPPVTQRGSRPPPHCERLCGFVGIWGMHFSMENCEDE